MTFEEYQYLASRTIPRGLDNESMQDHALLGMASEVGELLGMFQKSFQGHEIDTNVLIKEIGDVLWFTAELCTALSLSMDGIASANIEKLKKRYPNGFEESRSLVRDENDI